MLVRPCVYFSKWKGSWFYRLWTGQRIVHVGQELVTEGLICKHLEDSVVSAGTRWEERASPHTSHQLPLCLPPFTFDIPGPKSWEVNRWERNVATSMSLCFLKSLSCDADKMPRAPANNHITRGKGRNMLAMFGWEDTVLVATMPGLYGLEGPLGQSICLLTLQDCDFPTCLAVTYSKNDIL